MSATGGAEKAPATGIEKAKVEYSQELTDSIAFSLIEDVLRTKEISDVEADFFRIKYQKLFETIASLNAHEQSLNKKSQSLMNEVLAEKILLERTRIEEAEETSSLRRLEETRNSVQKELEFSEQRDTMAKFELDELKKVHEELSLALANMRKENSNLVGPVIAKLRLEITENTDQLQQADEAFERESAQKALLNVRLAEITAIKDGKDSELGEKSHSLHLASSEPTRLSRQVEAIQRAVVSMESENRALARRLKSFEQDIEAQSNRRKEAEKLRKSLTEKLELNRQTIEKREQDVATVRANLETAKAKGHDLITTKVELNVRKREAESSARHRNDQLNLSNKEYDNLKRQLKKKRANTDAIRQLIPILTEQLKDQEMYLKVDRLDQNEQRRQWHLRTLWAAMSGLATAIIATWFK